MPPFAKTYHDIEWGVPLHDDRKHFECLMLEALQCGLSWNTILKKRDILRRCFLDFDYDAVAAFSQADIDGIIATEGMIRSERKVQAIRKNALVFQAIRQEFQSFDAYIWRVSGGKTLVYAGHSSGKIPSANRLSAEIAADLKRRGCTYLGPTTVYAYLQAAGIVNDHDARCPRFQELLAAYPSLHCKADGDRF